MCLDRCQWRRSRLRWTYRNTPDRVLYIWRCIECLRGDKWQESPWKSRNVVNVTVGEELHRTLQIDNYNRGYLPVALAESSTTVYEFERIHLVRQGTLNVKQVTRYSTFLRGVSWMWDVTHLFDFYQSFSVSRNKIVIKYLARECCFFKCAFLVVYIPEVQTLSSL